MSDYENAMTAGPRTAAANQVNAFRAGRAEAAGPTPGLAGRIAALTPDQKAHAARQAEILVAVGQSVAGRSYAERRAILAHMTPHLAGRGVEPQAVAAFDPTDANLASAVGHAVILRGMLAPSPAPAEPTPPGPEPTAG